MSPVNDGYNVKGEKRKAPGPIDQIEEEALAPSPRPGTRKKLFQTQNNSSPNQHGTPIPKNNSSSTQHGTPNPKNNTSPTPDGTLISQNNAIQLIQTPKSFTPSYNSTFDSSISRPDSAGGSKEILEGWPGVSVELEMEDGEYAVKIKRRRFTSSSDEMHNAEDSKELAQSAGMLFLQAQILRDMGEHLLTKYRDSLSYVIGASNRIEFTPL